LEQVSLYKRSAQVFHCHTKDPHSHCEQYQILMACMGMIVEQGGPLLIESGVNAEDHNGFLFAPDDWIKYFQRKGRDFVTSRQLPEVLLQMAPVAAFLTDGLSLPMTIHSILHSEEQQWSSIKDAATQQSTKWILYILTSPDTMTTMPMEQEGVSRYVDLMRLNPNLQELEIILVGPNLRNQPDIDLTEMTTTPLRSKLCRATLSCKVGLYHEEEKNLPGPPTLVICPNAILYNDNDDGTNTKSFWKPILLHLAKQNVASVVITGRTHKDVVKNACILEKDWDCIVEVPPTPNPFRGCRPHLDPLRDGDDDEEEFVYANASYCIVKGQHDLD